MDSTGYLSSYGWRPGEPLKHGGLKRPILVSHKKDTRGLGHRPAAHDHETWWERIFDGQLKGLDVGKSDKEVSFSQRELVVSGISKNVSPLYRMFVQGEGLKGTINDKVRPTCTTDTSTKLNGQNGVISLIEEDSKAARKRKAETNIRKEKDHRKNNEDKHKSMEMKKKKTKKSKKDKKSTKSESSYPDQDQEEVDEWMRRTIKEMKKRGEKRKSKTSS